MNKILRSKIFTVGMLLLIVWISVRLIKIDERKTAVNQEIESLQDKIGLIEKSNKYLEKFLANLSDPSFLEKEARIKLNYKVADENMAFVYFDGNSRITSGSEANDVSGAKWYQKLWYFLFRR